MGAKVKALIWEECRVGGAIAATCFGIGILLLASCWSSVGVDAWARSPGSIGIVVLGIPMLTAALLILNPNYSGHLVGGFSGRVLRLPVRTAVAVAVTLGARTGLVFLTAFVMTSLSIRFFEESPGLETVYLITLFYLIVQVLDWLRSPLSGLSSLIVLSVIAAGLLRLIPTPIDLLAAFSGFSQSGLLLSFAAAMAISYGVSLIAVRADRAGRQIGVPEIWELPKRISYTRATAHEPFKSPLSAQVWFELRRSGWILPAGTLVLSIAFIGAVWIYENMGNDWRDVDYGPKSLPVASAFLIFAAFVCAAGIQGLWTRVLGLRNRPRKPTYEHLQPFTSAEFAGARAIAHCLVLFPTIAVVLTLHFFLGGGLSLVEVISDALESGVTSLREVVWIVTSRGLLAAALGWLLVGAGTRVFRMIVGVFIVEMTLLFILTVLLVLILDIDPFGSYSRVAVSPFMVFLVALCIWLFRYSLKQGIIPARSVAVWAGTWALAAWLFYYALIPAWFAETEGIRDYAGGLVTALGCASIVPLSYVAAVLDLRRRRHNAAPPQDPAQHSRSAAGGIPGYAIVGLACIAIFVLWLGMPVAPAYEEVWRSKGYPVTLSELNDWYPEPSLGENYAPEYIELAREDRRLMLAYQNRLLDTPRQTRLETGFYDELLVMGRADFTRAEPMPADAWLVSEAYWLEVTSHTASSLHELAAHDTTKSRYPIDFRKGYRMELDHLSGLRNLARELHLDALHHAVASETEEATDSVLAIQSISDSLSNEPVLISQLARLALLGIETGTIQTVLNRCIPAENDLARMQEACARVLPDPAEGMIMDRAVIGESTMLQTRSYVFDDRHELWLRQTPNPYTLAAQLVYPFAAERMLIALRIEETIQARDLPWSEASKLGDEWENELIYDRSTFTSPIFRILFPEHTRYYEAEWRMRMGFETARAAIAVDRFRLAQGRLPEDLEELVPEYLAEVPRDYFAGGGAPLRYRVRDDGEYVVYSVADDGEDDLGEEMEKWWVEGDLTFTVAPLTVRTGNHIEAKETS